MKLLLLISAVLVAAQANPLFGGGKKDPNVIRTSCPMHFFVSCPSFGFFQHPDYCSLLEERPCPQGYVCCPSEPDFIIVKRKNGCCVQFNKTSTVAPEITTVSVITQEPETEAPETEEPETEAPETKQPETEAPETKEPETEAPETEEPETEEPETVAP